MKTPSSQPLLKAIARKRSIKTVYPSDMGAEGEYH